MKFIGFQDTEAIDAATEENVILQNSAEEVDLGSPSAEDENVPATNITSLVIEEVTVTVPQMENTDGDGENVSCK